MALPFQTEITDAYLNSDAAFTSVSTVHKALRRAALQSDSSARARVDFPTLSQVKDVLNLVDVATTTKPYKVRRGDYDSIVAWDTGTVESGRRRDQVQFDIIDWQRVWKSNRLRTSDTKTLAFNYAALFEDVYSRYAVLFPIIDKKASTLLRVFKQAWKLLGGWDNLTADGESALNTAQTNMNGVKRWMAEMKPPSRLWLSLKPERGGSQTYMVERLIRTLREAWHKRAIASGTRIWALPPEEYWLQNVPPQAAALGIPANSSIPQRKRAAISSDVLIPSPIQQIVHAYNNRRHSALGATPREVLVDGALPLYKRNQQMYGTCVDGAQCTPQQRVGVRRRAIKKLFRAGDRVRLLKTIRGFGKRSESKVWSAGIWEILNTDHASGLSNFSQGPRPNIPVPSGESRRFLIKRLSDGRTRVALHWQLQKLPVDAVVVKPLDPRVARLQAPRKKQSEKVQNQFDVQPIQFDKGKAASGRRGKRFTQSARDDASTARARALADIGLTVDDEPDQTPIRTRASSAPVASRVGRRKPAPSKSSPRNKKVFRKGDIVSAYYPSEKRSFTGRVTSLEGKNVVVRFDPSDLEPDGSEAEFEPPYSFLKRVA